MKKEDNKKSSKKVSEVFDNDEVVDEEVLERVDEIVEEFVASNENVEKGLEIIDKQVSEIEELQEQLVKEKCEKVELLAKIEKEKNDNVELFKENKKLRMSISFFRLVFFFIFTVIVFVGGGYIGTKLVDLDNFLYGEEEEINPIEDKKINFAKLSANVELDKFYGRVMSNKGFISKILNQEEVPDSIDLYNNYEYRLSLVPRFDEKIYEETMFPYVSYDTFKRSYKQIYGLENLDDIFSEMEGYPMLVDGNKVLFDDYLETGVTVKFSSEEIVYTAKDKVYTMTGIYEEVAGDYSVLYGTFVKGSFELKYKMDDVGNKRIIGMVINKDEMNLSKTDF